MSIFRPKKKNKKNKMAIKNNNSNNRRFGVEFEFYFTKKNFARLILDHFDQLKQLAGWDGIDWVDIKKELLKGDPDDFLIHTGVHASEVLQEVMKKKLPMLLSKKWIIDEDSSIQGNDVYEEASFEIKTPPITIASGGFEQIDAFCQFFKNYATVNKSTGLHVHIEAKEFLSFKGKDQQASSTIKLMTALMAYKSVEPYFDRLVSVDRRANKNRYALATQKEDEVYQQYKQALKNIEEGSNIDDVVYAFTNHRYQKLNLESLMKFGTLEFRQMHGTFNEKLIKNWILLGMNFIDTVLQIESTVNAYFVKVGEETMAQQRQLTQMIPAKVKRDFSSYDIKEVLYDMTYESDRLVRRSAFETYSKWVNNDPNLVSQAKLIIAAIGNKKLNKQKETEAIEYLKKAIQSKQKKLVPTGLFNKAQRAYQASPIAEEAGEE